MKTQKFLAGIGLLSIFMVLVLTISSFTTAETTDLLQNKVVEMV